MTRAQTTSTTQQNTGGAVVPFAAGKNKILNGDFFINQRGFSSSTTSGDYTFDRWKIFASLNTGSATYSAQTFTAGTAPVTGYEARNYYRCVTSGTASANTASYSFFTQYIEDVRTFANQTVTVSFWAKAASGTPKIALELTQYFGTGGSPSSNVNTYGGQATLSTSWARYSITVAVPSITGKTIGTTANTSALLTSFWVTAGSDFNTRTGSLGLQDNTFDMWGFQIESGSVATPFQTATGTLQGELAACQRYYWRINAQNIYDIFGIAIPTGTTTAYALIQHPVTMRVKPSAIEYSTLTVADAGVGSGTSGTFVINYAGLGSTQIYGSSLSGLTTNRPCFVNANNSTSAYLGFTSEY